MHTKDYCTQASYMMRQWRSMAFLLIALLGWHVAWLMHSHHRSVYALALEHTQLSPLFVNILAGIGIYLMFDVYSTFRWRAAQGVCRILRPIVLMCAGLVWLTLSFLCAKADGGDGSMDFADVYLFWLIMGIVCSAAALLTSLQRYYANHKTKFKTGEDNKDVQAID